MTLKTASSKRIAYAPVLLILALNLVSSVAVAREIDPEIKVVPTFECIGIYRGAIGDSLVTCDPYYREYGLLDWERGHPLWYDARDSGYLFHPPEYSRDDIPLQDSYRGSIVGLSPGTLYEIELRFSDGETKYTTCQTWPEEFPTDGNPVYLDDSTEPLIVTDGGSAGAYKRYTHGISEETATIDLLDEASSENPDEPCIYIDASYVIIDELTLIGGRSGIRIGQGRTDIVIQGCDISQWGQSNVIYPDLGNDGIGGLHGGIHAERGSGEPSQGHLDTKRLVIQGNVIHDPLYDTNHWREYSVHGHPEGPSAIRLHTVGGNNVIRFNDFYSSENHYFNDIVGGGENFSLNGCPGPDTDIYGNTFSHCWDDAIEAEGGGRNIRIWNNYMNEVYVPVALATTAIGPVYVWRNIIGISRLNDDEETGDPTDEVMAGRFIKVGQGCDNLSSPWPFNCTEFYGNGKIYIYHNTALQPRWDGDEQTDNGFGVDGGIENSHDLGPGHNSEDRGPVHNIVAINNILNAHRYVVCTYEEGLYLGPSYGLSNHYAHNIWRDNSYNFSICEQDRQYVETEFDGFADYDDGNYNPLDETGIFGQFWLADTDVFGLDNALLIRNFNDMYVDPDIGAHERGTDPLKFGVDLWGNDAWGSTASGGTIPPVNFEIIGNYPNPFNPRTEIRFALRLADSAPDAKVAASLVVFDITGRRVVDLLAGEISPGEHAIQWDGRNQEGQDSSSGVYFASLRIASQVRTWKLTLLR